MFGCHLFPTVVWERSDGGQLSSLSSRPLVDHDQVACFCLGDVISEGRNSQYVAETKVRG